MFNSNYCRLLFILLINVCYSKDLYSDRVRKYDTEAFKSHVGGGIPHLVNFFAPWCGFCKRLIPVWDELADKYNVDSPNQKIVIASVDCTSETPLCSDENVSGYPSLVFYDAGETKGIKYEGKRDLTGLEEFIGKNLGGTSKKRMMPPARNPQNGFSLELTDETFHDTIDVGMHFVKFYAPWCGHCQRMAGAWEELAEFSLSDTSVTISSVDCTKYRMSCADFDIKGFPTLLFIIDGKKVEKYHGSRNLVGFTQFVTEMKNANNDRLQADNEKISSSELDLVVELTKDNFENTISKGYSFVKYFVPWCGHSKKLSPIWSELAVKFATNADVKIAKLNCIQNDEICVKNNVVGYPTLLLFHNGKYLAEFKGNRELQDLHSFVLGYLHHTEL